MPGQRRARETRRAAKVAVQRAPRSRREVRARKRPAEKVGVAGGGIVGVAYALGVRDPEALLVLGVVSSVAPAVVTGLIANGGILGLLQAVLRGR